jgi:Holliday junction DNA helicase RuvA
MIAQLRGVVLGKDSDGLVLDVGGVGYAVVVSAADHGSSLTGEETSLHIYEHIREDAHDLYGFSNLPSKRFFQQLLSINGVGPKVALGILSAASLPQLQQAIASGDADVFKGVAGVGKKTAERIMIELKGKIESPGLVDQLGGPTASDGDPAYQALIGLGYTAQQAAQAVAAIPGDITDEQARVKAALKQVG